VSVPEMKAFLGLIINMALMPLPDIKDYRSSEWITKKKFFDDVMSRVRFLQIFWMMHVGNDSTMRVTRYSCNPCHCHTVMCRVVHTTKMTGSSLDDWIYQHLVTHAHLITCTYMQYSVIAHLHTFQFTVAQTLGLLCLH
jgi:hypothetical protein